MRPRWTIAMVLVLGLGFSVDAAALANRVFISARSGSDLNTCDNINAPCQTFAGAMPKLNPGGEAIVLDSGGYGPVTITKAVTIEAPPGVLAFVHPPGGNAIQVSAGAGDTVVLRGLVLNGGTGNGIEADTVGVLHVENCVISGFTTGLAFVATGQLFVKDTIVRNNSNAGISVSGNSGTPKASIDRCRAENNGAGFNLTRGSGTVRDSVASGNGAYGFIGASLTGDPVDLNIENCLAAGNGSLGAAGISSQNAGATVRVSGTTVTANLTGLLPLSGGIMLSRGNNTVEGNGTNGTFTGTYTAK